MSRSPSAYTAARRYAQAFFASLQGAALNKAADDLAAVATALRSSPDLNTFISSPVVDNFRKRRVVRSTFEKNLGAESLRFLDFVAVRERLDLLPIILKTFNELLMKSRGEWVVQVTSAVALSKAQLDKLQGALVKRLQHDCRLDSRIDPELRAGFSLLWKNRLLDYSLRGHLQRLNAALLGQSLA